MIIYTVHEPQHTAESIEARADSVVFVKEGFTIWGFLLGPIWLLINRLWLEFIVAIIAAAALGAGLAELGLREQAPGIIDILFALIIGFEGNDLIRWRLHRKGYAFLASVAGRSLEDCEHRFFNAWVAHVRGGPAAIPVMDLKSGGWRSPNTIGTWPEAAA
jgi:hypothetical protein